MKFEDYKKNADKEWHNFRDKVLVTVAQEERNRTYQLYMNWTMQETNKKLVWATWALAVGTLILSGLTLYFQYGVKH